MIGIGREDLQETERIKRTEDNTDETDDMTKLIDCFDFSFKYFIHLVVSKQVYLIYGQIDKVLI